MTSESTGEIRSERGEFRVTGADYLVEYNDLLSRAGLELAGRFGATASPTLSKQETVTNLHSGICAYADAGRRPAFPWSSVLKFVPRLARVTLNLFKASLRFRVRQLPKSAIYFRTWLVPRSMRGGSLVDDYFRSLPDELSRHHDVIVAFQPMDYSLLKKLGKIRRSDNHIVPVGLLSVLDICRLTVDYLCSAHVKLKGRYLYGGRDVSAALNRSLLLDYLDLRSFQAYVEKYVCKALLRFKPKAFVYIFENQSLEKVCCSILKAWGTRLIGYQSSGFSRVFLNFFPTRLDAATHPMPDVILTVGPLFTRRLLDCGSFRMPVKTFAALRFDYPNDGCRYAVMQPNPELLKRVLYAFPVQVDQYESTIASLVKIFGDTEIVVDLKIHPIVRKEGLACLEGLPGNFNLVDRVEMAHLASTYDVVLFNDNSVGLESLFMGVRSYQYDASGRFEDDRFFYFDLWDTRLNYEGLRALRDRILSGTYEKKYDSRAVADYLNDMYRPYAGDPRLFLELAGLPFSSSQVEG